MPQTLSPSSADHTLSAPGAGPGPGPGLFGLVAARLAEEPDRTLIETADGNALSRRAFMRLVEAQAGVLTVRGVRPGDRVAARVEKSPAAFALHLACARGGFVFLPINTAYRREEVAYLIADAEPRAIVCDPGLAAESAEIGAAATAQPVELLTLDAAGNGTLADAVAAFAAFAPVSGGVAVVPAHPVADTDLAAILYTSGTTGRPKGAMLSHGNLTANARALVDAWGFTEADVLLHALPIFHTHGLFVAGHCALLSGARMVWLARFEPDAVIARLPAASVFMGVPTYYTRLLGTPDFGPACCRSIRLFVSGSAPLLAETFQAMQARTGHTILERYGMTETGMNTSNPLAEAGVGASAGRKVGSVGPPLPGVAVRITDDAGALLPNGRVGGVEVRGPNVFSGYWRRPERVPEDFTGDGWFRTGDLGRLDDDGYLHLVGRAKDLIITGGYNVYPKEIESVIDEIAGVVESAVIGLPDADFGEAVVAIVVLEEGRETPDAAAVTAAVRARLANYKVPKRVAFVDQLPRNAMGKVQKAELRSTFSVLAS